MEGQQQQTWIQNIEMQKGTPPYLKEILDLGAPEEIQHIVAQ